MSQEGLKLLGCNLPQIYNYLCKFYMDTQFTMHMQLAEFSIAFPSTPKALK